MQDQIISQGQKLSRREYNRLYYQMNKEKIQQKRKDKDEVQPHPVQLENVQVAEEPAKKSGILQTIIRVIEITALVLLTLIMTYLLIKETAGFYLDSNESVFSAYIKAAMIEITAVIFSFSRRPNLFLQWGQRGVVVMLCGLSLFHMTL